MPGSESGRASGLGRKRRAGVALLAVVVATGACTPLDNALAKVFWGRSMRSSVSFDPYENEDPHGPDSLAVSFASGNYPARVGQVNLGEPEGLEQDIPPFTKDDMGFRREIADGLVNPVPADAASLARGQVVYERMCAVCHGLAGLSAEAPMAPVVPLGILLEALGNLAQGNALNLTDGYIYGMIRVGRGAMPAYGARVTHFDRWHVVNYVRELQRRAAGGGAGN